MNERERCGLHLATFQIIKVDLVNGGPGGSTTGMNYNMIIIIPWLLHHSIMRTEIKIVSIFDLLKERQNTISIDNDMVFSNQRMHCFVLNFKILFIRRTTNLSQIYNQTCGQQLRSTGSVRQE